MLPGELVERHQPFPILRQPLHGFGCQFPIASGELYSERLTRGLRLGIGQGTQQRAGLGLMFLGHRIKHIRNAVMPAPLLGQGGILFPQCRPQA
jgi:hypothetical protein